MMRRKIAVICGAVLLAVVLLGGCSSVASGTVRTTAAVEVSQETKTAEPAENSDTTQESVDSKTGGEKPHVVLQQNETESSEAETGSADPYADLLKDPEVMAANKIYVKETQTYSRKDFICNILSAHAGHTDHRPRPYRPE